MPRPPHLKVPHDQDVFAALADRVLKRRQRLRRRKHVAAVPGRLAAAAPDRPAHLAGAPEAEVLLLLLLLPLLLMMKVLLI